VQSFYLDYRVSLLNSSKLMPDDCCCVGLTPLPSELIGTFAPRPLPVDVGCALLLPKMSIELIALLSPLAAFNSADALVPCDADATDDDVVRIALPCALEFADAIPLALVARNGCGVAEAKSPNMSLLALEPNAADIDDAVPGLACAAVGPLDVCHGADPNRSNEFECAVPLLAGAAADTNGSKARVAALLCVVCVFVGGVSAPSMSNNAGDDADEAIFVLAAGADWAVGADVTASSPSMSNRPATVFGAFAAVFGTGALLAVALVLLLLVLLVTLAFAAPAARRRRPVGGGASVTPRMPATRTATSSIIGRLLGSPSNNHAIVCCRFGSYRASQPTGM